ncbi:dihydrodipicolinate reductase [Novosphingobium bradum]|uniref:Dihydrodipicolinate reductase n=1 Tax=Novosphingobium bradum TaxID=1737444 RepID=A0ABV7IT45_9SPHN
MPLRVVHTGTGQIGRAALDGVLNNPDLELVGMYVQSPEKIGQDAGRFVNRPDTGIIATNDWDALLALDADCLSYHSNSIGREREAADDIIRFLERGTNAVTTAAFAWAYPPEIPEGFEHVREACAKGGTSVFMSGSDPGWGTTDLALTALAVADKVEFVRMGRYGYWGKHTAEYVCRHYYGFGQGPDFVPMLVSDGFLRQNWGPALQHIAEALGIVIDDWNVVWETDSLPHDIECGFGTVKAGTSSVLRTELQAISQGRVIAVFEHVDRMALEAGPQWGKPNLPGTVAFRVEVTGNHSFMLEFTTTGSTTPEGYAGPLEYLGGKSTAMPLINAIPLVCAAPPGVLGPRDVPFAGARHRR